MWKTGHSLIKAKMKELKAPLAGEMSGHMFFGGDYYGFDDALFAAARLLDYLAKTDDPVSVLLSNLPARCSTPELRVDCDDDKKFAIVERAVKHFSAKYETLDIDGVRMSFADGWGLIRASNTQPALVLRFEASTEENLAAYRGEVEEWLRGELGQ
jgi:phosphomannomutase/phosphoglucomutase